MKLLNAFSINMIRDFPSRILIEQITVGAATEYARLATSAVGHTDTAAVFSSVLGITVPMNRATVSLGTGESALVGQYAGPRLPEGTTTLPTGATIKWFLVVIK